MFVYLQITIDTLFLCFCEDCERNDGVTKPYFMSKNLMVSKLLHDI
jgi:solute carrier family 44 protein 1 (choline transporter-like protein)